MPNECGTCTLCCKLLAVDELQKLGGEWCAFCSTNMIYPSKGGCQIHESANFPPSCKRFACLWLSSVWPAHLRPNHSGVVFVGGPDKLIQAHTEDAGYLESGELQWVMAKIRNEGYTLQVVVVKRRGNR